MVPVLELFMLSLGSQSPLVGCRTIAIAESMKWEKRKHLGKTLTHREQDIKIRSDSSAPGPQDLWVVDKNCFYFSSRALPLVLLLKNANKETDPLCHRS